MELAEGISILTIWAIQIWICVRIAYWGAGKGMRWGQVFLFGFWLSPIVSAIIVAFYNGKPKRLILQK